MCSTILSTIDNLCTKKIDIVNVCFVCNGSEKSIMSLDDAFFNRNWAGASWNCWAGLLALDAGLLCKNKKPKGSTGARPLPLRCLSQFFPMEEKINCSGNEVLCIPFTDMVAWYL